MPSHKEGRWSRRKTSARSRHAAPSRPAFRWFFVEPLEQRILLTAVASVNPAADSHQAPVSTNIAATFDQNINAATATAQNFVVHSRMRAGAVTLSTTGPTITADPTSDFLPGELVQASVTSAVQSTSVEAADPYVWQFRTAAAAGTGVFTESPQTLANVDNRGVALGDLDGDGDLDAFVTVLSGGGSRVWMNDGTGAFQNSGQTLGNHFGIELGDLDGDGDLDAFAAGAEDLETGTGNHRVWLNSGTGQFTSTSQLMPSAGVWVQVSLGDLDVDGDLDAFVTHTAGLSDRVWLNNGDGAFTDSGQQVGNHASQNVALGDVDGDGDLDAYVVTSSQNRLWLNNGGIFTDSGQLLGEHSSRGVALGDVDADGDLDALVVNSYGQANRLWQNNGSGDFSDSGQAPGVSSTDVALGDLDGDGDLDAFFANNRGVWLNSGGQFTDTGQVLGSTAELGDLDGDGDLDAFAITNTQNRVWLNQSPAITVTLSVDDTTIAESLGAATVLATLSAAATQDVILNLDITGTAAGAGIDYTATGSQITVPAGSTTGLISLTAAQDTLDESDETIIVDLGSITGGATESGDQQVTITIVDDDESPTIDLTVDDTTISESGGGTNMTAALSAVSGRDVTIDVVAGGTATQGTDYSLSTTQIVIAAGATSGTAALTSIDDSIDEPDETVDLTITATNAEVGVGRQSVAIIDNDDPPTVTLSVDDETIEEDGGIARFTVALSAPAVAAVTVNLGVGGSATVTTDYTLSGTQIVIPPGEISGGVTLTSVADLLITEGPETVTLDIADVSTNATESGEQSATVTIIDDVNGPAVTLSIDSANISEDGGVATVTATIADVFTLPVTVDLGFSGEAILGTDYNVSTTQISVPVGLTSGTMTITGTDDAMFESNEMVVLDIVNVFNGKESNDQQVSTTIIDDDDPPTVTLIIDTASIAEAAGMATFTATLSAISGQDVTVNLAVTGTATQGSDYDISATEIVIAAGEISGSVRVTALPDTEDDNDETVIVDVDSVTGANEDGTQQQTTIITDDDDPEVTLSVDKPLIVEEAGVATFAATLSSAATAPVTIDLEFGGSATSMADYTSSGSQITIPLGETMGSITVTAVQDTASEPNETVIVEVSGATNSQVVAAQIAITTIEDDDGPPRATLEVDTETIAEMGGVATVTARLSRPSDQPSTIALSFSGTASASDYRISDSQIAIPAGSTNGTVTITAVDDTIPEGNQTVIVGIESATNAVEEGTQQVTATIVDDEPQRTVSLFLQSNSTIPENNGQARVVAFLSGITESPVVIDFEFGGTATLGEDYDGPGQVIINPGGLNATATFTSTNDALDEEDETVSIAAAQITGAAGGGSVEFTITDDDVVPEANISIRDASLLESIGRTTVQVRLSTPALQTVTVNLDYSSGTAVLGDDFDGPTQLTIQPGGFSAESVIAALPDTLDEDDEQLIARIVSITGATIRTDQASTTITDDDPEPTVSLSVGSTEIEEGAATPLTATLSAVSGRDVAVELAFVGTATIDTDYTAVGQIEIPAGSTSASIELIANPDLLDDPGETVTVSIADVTNATVAGEQQRVTLTILNIAPPVVPDVTLSAVPSEIPEEAGVSTISATLSESTTVPVTVEVAVMASSTATANDDYTVSGLEITIPPGGTSGSVTVTTVADQIEESDETLTLEIISVIGGNEVGQQSATVTIVDDDAPPTFQVTNLTPTSSGFTAELSAELDPNVLNLYDTQSADAGPPDVIVQGEAVGVVSGSLVVDPSRRHVSFVTSGGPLVADNYTVTLMSGETAFKDVAGNLLDGDQDGSGGGNFSSSFTIPGAELAIVSLPDFVRGPGQEVHLPAGTTTGIPLTISRGAGVRAATIHIDYDPALLEITEASAGTAMPAGATVDLDTSVAGTAVVTFLSSADLPPEEIVLVNLQARIPTENVASNYARQQVLNLHSVVLTDSNANTISTLADDAVHLVSYFADVSGNGRINAADAAQVARVAALIDSGFGATLLTDPGIVGDISGNGRLNAADASLVAQKAALIDVSDVPDVPAGVITAGSVGPGLLKFRAANDSVPGTRADPSIASNDAATSASSNLIPPAVDLTMIELDRSLSEENGPVSLEEAIEELYLSTRFSARQR